MYYCTDICAYSGNCQLSELEAYTGVFQRAHFIMAGMQVIPEITSGVSVEFVALCTVN